MYTVRYYRREDNDWVYIFSKVYDSMGDIETNLPKKLQARVYDEFYEKVKVITGSES